jgi:hypothetical protein
MLAPVIIKPAGAWPLFFSSSIYTGSGVVSPEVQWLELDADYSPTPRGVNRPKYTEKIEVTSSRNLIHYIQKRWYTRSETAEVTSLNSCRASISLYAAYVYCDMRAQIQNSGARTNILW